MVTWVSGLDAYEFTAMAAVEVAMCILDFQKKSLEEKGWKKPCGVQTPVSAFGDILIGKLQAAGIEFGEEPLKGSKL